MESTLYFLCKKGMIYYPKQTLEYLIWKVVGVINANSNSWDGNYKVEKITIIRLLVHYKINDSLTITCIFQ
jgi:hypothetical protein